MTKLHKKPKPKNRVMSFYHFMETSSLLNGSKIEVPIIMECKVKFILSIPEKVTILSFIAGRGYDNYMEAIGAYMKKAVNKKVIIDYILKHEL